jgi:HK97 family phage major capsid protein
MMLSIPRLINHTSLSPISGVPALRCGRLWHFRPQRRVSHERSVVVKDLFDRAEDLLAATVFPSEHVVRTLAGELLAEAELLAGGDGSSGDLELISRAQALTEELFTRVKSDQQRRQRDAIAQTRDKWDSVPDPYQAIIRGQPLPGEVRPTPPRSPGARCSADYFGPAAKSPWRPGEFLAVISQGLHDPRLQAAMREGAPGSGGFMVPQETEYRLLDVPLHTSIVLPRAEIIPMATRTKLVPGYDGTDQSSTLYGFTFDWLRENEEGTVGTGNVRAIELVARPGAIYLEASNELVADTPEFEANLEGRLQVAIGEVLDYHYLNGSGAGMPLGVLKSPALIVVSKESAQSADTLVWANIVKMFARHSAPMSAVWVCSPSCLTQLLTLTTTGNAGSSLPAVIQGADGALSMLGRPVLPSHKMPVLGDQGDIGLYDFSAYYVGLRQGMALERSGHIGFTRNQMNYRMVLRLDGMPKLNTPITGKDNQTYSPFVTLEAR